MGFWIQNLQATDGSDWERRDVLDIHYAMVMLETCLLTSTGWQLAEESFVSGCFCIVCPVTLFICLACLLKNEWTGLNQNITIKFRD